MSNNGTAPVGVSENIKQLGRMDLPGGGSVVVENGYAYVGHMDPPHGTSIIDVKDPKNPKVVAHLEIPEGLHSHKVRVSGDIMLINYERYKGKQQLQSGLKVSTSPTEPNRAKYIFTKLTARAFTASPSTAATPTSRRRWRATTATSR